MNLSYCVSSHLSPPTVWIQFRSPSDVVLSIQLAPECSRSSGKRVTHVADTGSGGFVFLGPSYFLTHVIRHCPLPANRAAEVQKCQYRDDICLKYDNLLLQVRYFNGLGYSFIGLGSISLSLRLKSLISMASTLNPF